MRSVLANVATSCTASVRQGSENGKVASQRGEMDRPGYVGSASHPG